MGIICQDGLLVADLHYWIQVLIPILIRTANQMATFNMQNFPHCRVSFRFQSQLPSTVMGLELGLESVSLNVNKP